MPSASLWALVIAIGLFCFKLTLDLAGAKRELKDSDERICLLTAERDKVYNDYQNAEDYFRQTLETEIKSLKEKHFQEIERVANLSAEQSVNAVIDKLEESISRFEQNKTSF